jgi:hypothetical protein
MSRATKASTSLIWAMATGRVVGSRMRWTMSSRSVPCLSTERFMTDCSFIAISGPGSATGVTDLDAVTTGTEHLDRHVGGGVVRPGVCGCVESIARIVARLVELDLTDFEHVDLDRSVRRREQHRSRLHRLCTVGCSEDFELRYVAEQAVDDVEVDCGAVRTGQPGQYGEAADDYRWSTDESAHLGDPLNNSGHRVAQEGDAATRHVPTARLASRR